MPITSEAHALCANPQCDQPKRHGGFCDDEETFSALIVRTAREHERLVDELHAAADTAGVSHDEADALLVEEIGEEPVNFEDSDDVHTVRAVIDAAGKLPIDQFNATPDLAAAINALYVHFESRINKLDQHEKSHA